MEPVGYHSFLVRFWRETSADGGDQWCGEVEHIQSGRVQRFTAVDALLAFLRPIAVPNETNEGWQVRSRHTQQADEDAP
jgi:hypothetical protein